jgi:hypothetical protein
VAYGGDVCGKFVTKGEYGSPYGVDVRGKYVIELVY